MTDSQSIQQTLTSRRFGSFQCGQKIGGGFFSHPGQGGDVLLPQGIQIPHVGYQPVVDEQLHQRRPQTVDIHGAPTGKMGDPPFQLGRASRIHTPEDTGRRDPGTVRLLTREGIGCLMGRTGFPGGFGGFLLLCGVIPEQRFPAGGTLFREDKDFLRAIPLFGYGADDFRDDVPRLLHFYPVPQTHIPFSDDVDIVQGRPGYGGSGQLYRFQNGGRGQHARPAHLYFDIQQPGDLLFRRVFEGGGPFGGGRPFSQNGALGQAVDLHHGAVDVVGQGFPHPSDFRHGFHHGFHIGGDGLDPDGLQSQLCHAVDGFPVGCGGMPVRPQIACLVVEHEDGQSRFLCAGGVQSAQIPGSGVSGVGPQLFPGGLFLFVQGGKALVGHVYFPADGKVYGIGQRMGNIVNHGNVFGDVFADGAVSPGGAQDQSAVFIGQAYGKTVDLGFHGKENFFRGDSVLQQGISGSGQKRPQFVGVKHVRQAPHFHGMGYLGELFAGLSADPSGGGIRFRQLRPGFFQFGQFPEQGVVFVVGDLRRIVFVVQFGMMGYGFPQGFEPGTGLFNGHIVYSPDGDEGICR